ncbi:chaplin [Streptomyces sp. NPDC048196]|uniref:chaplin n=1 Tax=Streptomyces sp. NPDC048196 TaxID=3154712 RepID=UPI0034040635
MKRFIKTAAMATTSCALVLSGAGMASASGDGHNGHNGRHGHHRHHHHGRHIERYDHRGFVYGHHGGANAYGGAAHSPGFLSGNNVQVPINIPINICGNSINILALLNPTFGNVCINR